MENLAQKMVQVKITKFWPNFMFGWYFFFIFILWKIELKE